MAVPTLHVGFVTAYLHEDDHRDDPELSFIAPAVEETYQLRVQGARSSPETQRQIRELQRVAYCWGWNGSGRLGTGTQTDSNVPVAVSGGLTFQAVSAGNIHSCGVTTAGVAYCWGEMRALGPVAVFLFGHPRLAVLVALGIFVSVVGAGWFLLQRWRLRRLRRRESASVG